MSFSNVLLRSTIVLGFLGAVTVRAGIDLTPSVSEYTAEGTKFQQLSFHDSKQRIEYELPSGWSFDGNANELRVKPPQKTFAEGVIQPTPLTKAQPLDESVRNSLKQKVLAELPAGSQLAKIDQEIESPLLLNGQPTFEVIVSYQLLGDKFCRSALFGNRQNTQWLFRFTAKKADFESLQSEFTRSILSWHWLESADSASQGGGAGPPSASR